MKTTVRATAWPVVRLAELQKEGKIYLDDSFQSYSRWVLETNQKYMRSLLEGRAPTPITLGKISTLRDNIEISFGKEHPDYKFYQDLLDRGYEYITIDGNNRDLCVFAFISGLFALVLGTYEIGEQGDPIHKFVADKSGSRFEDLSPEVQQAVESILMNIHLVTSATREDLAHLFAAINEGINLNDQEKRNAIVCRLGQMVRDCVKENETAFAEIYTEKARVRRTPDQLVVDISILVAHGCITIGPKVRTKAYGDDTDEAASFKTTKKIVKQLCDLVVDFGVDGLKAGKKTDSNLIDLALLLIYMNKHSIIIKDRQAFYDQFVIAQAKRVDDPTELWNNGRKDDDPKGFKEATDWRGYAGIQKNLQQNFLEIREGVLVRSLADFEEGVLCYKDNTRNFKRESGFLVRLWESQGRKCAISGKKILPRQLFDGKLVQVDHVKPHSKGGQTVEANAQLTFALENQKKGAKYDEELGDVPFIT
jgi:hypothetical protein